MKRSAFKLTAALIVLALSSCGAARHSARTTAAATHREQLLFAFPKLGRLYADCHAPDVIRLTYTANRDADEQLRLFVNSKGRARPHLDPGRSFRFKVGVVHRPSSGDTIDESPRITLAASTSREPYGTRAVNRFKLLQARDGSGECLAKSANVRVTGDPHLGPP